ncbi:MAG TPA: DUF2934 domain-containing protein [Steroidobacteraceae bacterium]|nr:DUF2934 domain-containing protein [Steroidobacteraceae bacterium]
MTTSRTSARSTSKAPRPVLHAKKSQDDHSSIADEALITHSALSRISDSDDRHAMIERLAYQYAESRGFSPGHDIEDWLAAEAEVDARLVGERAS